MDLFRDATKMPPQFEWTRVGAHGMKAGAWRLARCRVDGVAVYVLTHDDGRRWQCASAEAARAVAEEENGK